jgi:hypothetical protein
MSAKCDVHADGQGNGHSCGQTPLQCKQTDDLFHLDK